MQAVMTFSHTVFRALRHSLQQYFPRLLTTVPNHLEQPLLDQDEILDLRLRVFSRTQKSPSDHVDTAHQRMGDARSIHRGYGLDYEESRPYQAGDDPRYMNWALTARTGELYMKVFREERRPGIFILVDRRSSMRFGTHTRLKVTQAARVATCISFSALQRHASVSGAILNTTSQNPHWIKETGNEQDAYELIHAAITACPPNEYSQTTATNEPSFSHVLNMLQALIIPGTQVYLISDFIDLNEQHRGQLLHLVAENSIHAIHISDPAEHHLPKLGAVHFRTPSDHSESFLNTNATDVQAHYDSAAKDYFSTHPKLFRSLEISYTHISTRDDAIETLLAEPSPPSPLT
jgi:uncharacterized protein (DUF58 family)